MIRKEFLKAIARKALKEDKNFIFEYFIDIFESQDKIVLKRRGRKWEFSISSLMRS